MSAAMDSQHTLLLVSNHSKFSFKEWDNIVTVMSEGKLAEDQTYHYSHNTQTCKKQDSIPDSSVLQNCL